MKKKKRRLIILACVTALIIAFVLSPIFPYIRSLAVMKVYSPYCAKNSIMEEKNIELNIPSGEGWYPFVMTYEADEAFSDYTGIPGTKLSILYNFPDFSLKKGCSRFYDESSPYYSGFYGAYLVSRKDGKPYGFSKDINDPDESAIADIAKFDFFTLVLGDFGLKAQNHVFEYSLTDYDANESFLGYDGWTRISTDIKVNGANHTKRGFCASYLQYGEPNFPVSSDFAPIEMKSIVYAKYFPECDTAVFFYVLSPSEEVCESCVQTILSKSTFKTEK